MRGDILTNLEKLSEKGKIYILAEKDRVSITDGYLGFFLDRDDVRLDFQVEDGTYVYTKKIIEKATIPPIAEIFQGHLQADSYEDAHFVSIHGWRILVEEEHIPYYVLQSKNCQTCVAARYIRFIEKLAIQNSFQQQYEIKDRVEAIRFRVGLLGIVMPVDRELPRITLL